MLQLELLLLLVVDPDTDDAAGAGGEDQPGVGAHAGQHLAHQVVRLAHEHGLGGGNVLTL